MKCRICSIEHNNKAFCSLVCRNTWTAQNNRVNNPIKNPASLEKMRQKKLGQKHSTLTKQRMSLSHKEYLVTHPEEKLRLAKDVWDNYTSKIAGTGWVKVSKKIRERDNFACRSCGETEKRLVVHHLDWHGKQRGVSETLMNNEPSNLITLCDKCHNSIHRHKSYDYRERRDTIHAKGIKSSVS